MESVHVSQEVRHAFLILSLYFVFKVEKYIYVNDFLNNLKYLSNGSMVLCLSLYSVEKDTGVLCFTLEILVFVLFVILTNHGYLCRFCVAPWSVLYMN